MTPKTWKWAVVCTRLCLSAPSSTFELSMCISWNAWTLFCCLVTLQSENGNNAIWVRRLSIYGYNTLLSSTHKLASVIWNVATQLRRLKALVSHHLYSLYLLLLSTLRWNINKYIISMLAVGPGKIYWHWQHVCNLRPAMLTDPNHPLNQIHSMLLLQGSLLLSAHLSACRAHVTYISLQSRTRHMYIPSIRSDNLVIEPYVD
jgi:hypothetical protein